MADSTGVVVLFGPKAVGKSTIATLLEEHGGVHHVDPDLVVRALLAAGTEPHADTGWLDAVQREVLEELVHHRWVAVEATGAWQSDWVLAERLGVHVRVVRVWVTASLPTTLRRMASRQPPRVACTEQEARWIHAAATRRAAQQRVHAVVDTELVVPLPAARRVLGLLTAPEAP